MNKISVIIPIHNTANYLDKCISSVANQTYRHMEIILVNDGSTDGSAKIIESWTKKDDRIISCALENKGVAVARNMGLSIASGRYVYFLDSDDWIEDMMLESMIKVAVESDSDVVSCNFWFEYINNRELGIQWISNSDIVLKEWELEELFINYLSPESPGGYVGNKIYKLGVIKDNQLAFVDNKLVGGEDAYFNLCFLIYVKKSAFIGDPFHHYRQRRGSSMHQERPEIIYQYVSMISRFIDYCIEKRCAEKMKFIFPHLLYHFYSLGIQTALETHSKNEDILHYMNKGVQIPIFEEVMTQFYYNKNSKLFWQGYKGQNSYLRKCRVHIFLVLSLTGYHKTLLKISGLWLKIRKRKNSSGNRLFEAWNQDHNPLISIIMPVFNGGTYIDEAINSVCHQTYQNWQLIIIDDASTDNSGILARKMSRKEERIIVIDNQMNLGVSESRNKGIEIAKGDWIAFLDSDDLWEPDKLQQQLKLAEDKKADFVYSDYYIKEDGYDKVKSGSNLPKISKYKCIRQGNYIACSSVLIKKEIMQKFKFEQSALHEDYILWLKIMAFGTVAYCTEMPLVTIRISKKSRSADKKQSVIKAYKGYRYVGIRRAYACFYTITNAWRAVKKYSYYLLHRTKEKG